MVGPDAVLMADGPAVGDDDLARRGLEPAPALQRLVRVGRQAEDVGRVQARPAAVDVREVAERVDALAERLEAVAEGGPEGGRQRLDATPVERGLERVHRISRVPQRVAQVGAAEALPLPGGGDPGNPDRGMDRGDRPDVAEGGADDAGLLGSATVARTFDSTGIPMHKDNQTVVKERLFVDKTNPNILHNEITTIDHALTHPWTITKNYRRDTKVKQHYWWEESVCAEANPHIKLGQDVYYVSADGNLMPTKKGQKPPDLKYFKQSGK